MPKKLKGGADLPLSDIKNVGNLDYKQEYQAFNYDKYINAIKTSNFAGGCNNKKCVKLNKTLKEMYTYYMNGKPSNIRKIKLGGSTSLDDQFNISLLDTKNVSNLDYNKAWQYSDIKRLSTIPISNFEY